jgi:hypothetical protein
MHAALMQVQRVVWERGPLQRTALVAAACVCFIRLQQ